MSRDAGTAGNMPNAQTALHSPAPGANKSVVQRASYNRAGERNQTANPFLRRFLSQLESQPFRDAGRQPLENLFFGKVLAVIDARGCCSGHPQLQPFALTVVLEPIQKTQSLDQPQRQNRQKACVWNDRNHSAEAKSGPFQDRKAFRIPNQHFGDGIQSCHRHEVHMTKVRNVKPILLFELTPELFPVNFNRA